VKKKEPVEEFKFEEEPVLMKEISEEPDPDVYDGLDEFSD